MSNMSKKMKKSWTNWIDIDFGNIRFYVISSVYFEVKTMKEKSL